MSADREKKLNAVFVISQDSGGGAARAVHRIFTSVREFFSDEISCRMRVIHKSYDDEDIVGGKATRSRFEYAEYFIRTRFRKHFPRKEFVSDNKLLHSQALYPSGLGRELNAMNADVIMLGWLGNSTLSIEEIGRIKAPVVWRLSDMWVFSGAEHYTPLKRYVVGYSRASRPPSESGPDINRETFIRKRRHWRKPRHIISPSHWMADQVKKSVLTKDWPVHVIPNPIDADYWAPVERSKAREIWGFPGDSIVILFGTGGGTKHHHKGGDLLLEALPEVSRLLRGKGIERPIVCAIFGEDRDSALVGDVTVRFIGRLEDKELIAAYSSADVMVVPSRLDNLPSTAVEAQACATPVVAFRVGGLPDIVDDFSTGRIVEPFDVSELAAAICYVVEDQARNEEMGRAARLRAQALWSPRVVAQQYIEVLHLAASEGRR